MTTLACAALGGAAVVGCVDENENNKNVGDGRQVLVLDKLIPVETGRTFKKQMEAVGSRSELFLYKDQPHGFFNRRSSPEHFLATVTEMDRFLKSLGYLDGPPTIRVDNNK